MESLSSYARMFLGQMEKPDVDYIDGLSPGSRSSWRMLAMTMPPARLEAVSTLSVSR